MLKRTLFAAALAVGGLMTMAVGSASADEVEVDGPYSTLAACEVDGPHVEITHNDSAYTQWDCREGSDGLYHVWLSN